MPAKSKAQFRFMHAVASGKARRKPAGLSRREACEFVRGQSSTGLPARKRKRSR